MEGLGEMTEVERMQFCARKGALSLEMKGLKKRGQTAYSICNQEYGYSGSKQKVFDLMQQDFNNFVGEG